MRDSCLADGKLSERIHLSVTHATLSAIDRYRVYKCTHERVLLTQQEAIRELLCTALGLTGNE